MKRSLLSLISIVSISLFSQNNDTNVNNLNDWKALFGTIEQKVFMGKDALFLSRGLAFLPMSKFSNGIIEVDIAPMFPGLSGVAFHIDDQFNYNETYIRFAKSGGPDALQYSAVFNGEFSWQLYPEYQANVKYPQNEWIHLKVVIDGTHAVVYVMNADTAALLVDSLRVPNTMGSVGIWTLTPTYFSNFKYTPNNAAAIVSKEKFIRKINDNNFAIKEWNISSPFEYSETGMNTLERKTVAQLQWKRAATEPDGLLNICRFATKKIWGRTNKNSHDVVWLKYEWEEKDAGSKPFGFDYVNRCSIFLNERKIFSGNNSFLLKGALFRGDIDKQMRGNTVFLPTQKGKNTLMISVAHITNGWGFLGQFADGNISR